MNVHNEQERMIEHDIVGEADWQRWQMFYAIRRQETFQHILDTLEKHASPLS